ncbi:GAD-like domain-containing protein [Roseateles sp.]|uniref:GAD-like domain-containing protein n=1 Tax=Roseateles sp. TaxID=1971397 RepID=UPI00326680B8
MDQFFENFLGYKQFGPAFARKDVPAEKIEKFRGELPDKLLEYWQEHGWCGYGRGLFWTVDPDEWEDALDAWLGETKFMELDSFYVIARSAFGELVLWGKNTGQSLKIVPAYGWVFPAFDAETFARRGADKEIQLFFSSISSDAYDLKDVDDQPLFANALEKLGPLDHDTMYGFVPALALGGEPSLERLQKLDAHVHLDILSQMTELQVMADVAQAAKG